VAALSLVLGGTRSGKSRFAEQRAAAYPPVVYLATGFAGDAEMASRIALHRERRSSFDPPWETNEEPWDIAAAVADQSAAGCVLIEDLGLWLTNLLVGLPGRPACDDGAMRAACTCLVEAIKAAKGRVIVVSLEVGCGIVPVNALARRFADLLGEANQRLAEAADEVYWCVAGIPVALKTPGGG
jgi:adenosylcobinamide kinase / adenosylcobinamide-phosphate guanylyltransferase